MLSVSFYRPDWHGMTLPRPLFVSRHGNPDAQDDLTREAAREAHRLWMAFPGEAPGVYYDYDEDALYWRVPSDKAAGGKTKILHLRLRTTPEGP